MPYVYILSNKKHGTIYIGVTNNLVRRIHEHKEKIIKSFSQKYDLTKLVYYEVFDSIVDAITREKNLKNWKREWKVELIEKMNPEWEDLYYKIV
jgi:putative endonuclease